MNRQDSLRPPLSVIGLGKLGACTAACFAYRGFEVVGVDVSQRFVDAINAGQAPVCEPRLQDLISRSQGRLRATRDYAEAIRASEVTFLIVPTPSMDNGHFSDRYLCDALNQLALALRESQKKNHLFVITSTVSPGTTKTSLIPLIAAVSGRELGAGFDVCYNPEFIALGSVVSDFLNPDLVLIGQSNAAAGRLLQSIYEVACENKPAIARMSLVSAEITKISLNSYVTMKISFANTLANICEGIPEANVDDITRALGADKRVSPYYLRGGLSFGGPCFPRDNRAFAAFAAEQGVEAVLAKATDSVNHLQTRRLADHVMRACGEDGDPTVGILGLAYKPDTPVIEESAGIQLVEELLRREIRVIAYDPRAMDNVRDHFGDRVQLATSAKACMAQSSVCVVATPENEFKMIDENYVSGSRMTIVDCWRIIDPAKLKGRATYIPIGVCHDAAGRGPTRPTVPDAVRIVATSTRQRPSILEKT